MMYVKCPAWCLRHCEPPDKGQEVDPGAPCLVALSLFATLRWLEY